MFITDQAIAEGTFVVTANIAGPQQVSVVLANKKGYQKGVCVQPGNNNPCMLLDTVVL